MKGKVKKVTRGAVNSEVTLSWLVGQLLFLSSPTLQSINGVGGREGCVPVIKAQMWWWQSINSAGTESIRIRFISSAIR
jgi:molybdopterin-binding protein